MGQSKDKVTGGRNTGFASVSKRNYRPNNVGFYPVTVAEKVAVPSKSARLSDVLEELLSRVAALEAGGGGGGTEDAVQYIEQELTSSQKMQARKNQGLYYEGPTEFEARGGVYCGSSRSVVYTENNQTYKVCILPGAGDIPCPAPESLDDIISFYEGGNTIPVAGHIEQLAEDEPIYRVGDLESESPSAFFIVVLSDGASYNDDYVEGGIYAYQTEGYPTVSDLTYLADAVSKIESKYLPETPDPDLSGIIRTNGALWGVDSDTGESTTSKSDAAELLGVDEDVFDAIIAGNDARALSVPDENTGGKVVLAYNGLQKNLQYESDELVSTTTSVRYAYTIEGYAYQHASITVYEAVEEDPVYTIRGLQYNEPQQ